MWNEAGAALELKLAPHFHQTRWFYLLCAAAVVLLGVGAHRLRVRRMRTRYAVVFAERNRIARELHDTVEQGLAMIISQLDWGRRKLNDAPETAARHLEFAGHLARHNLDETRRYVWDLHDEELEKGDLTTALRQATDRLTAGTAIEVRVKVTGAAGQLPALVSHHLLRIGQEAMANAVRHARARRLFVALHFERAAVRLCVRDDGSGFDPAGAASGGHFGLIGMRERAEKIGGELTLSSRLGQGTEVAVTVLL
ncbi:MAG: sensor histidine kinase [Blastocatellia bacterium]